MLSERMHYGALAAEAEKLGLTMAAGESLAHHTTFRIGGPADLYAGASDLLSLRRLHLLAGQHGIPVTLLGGGSNVLVGDRGVRGLVIGNACRAVRQEGGLVVAESGAALAGLARWTMRLGLSGLEWAVSVPGTVGGAVIGNAGAHGSDTAQSLVWALVSAGDAPPARMTPADLRFAYRTSALKERLSTGAAIPLVLQAAFALTPGDPATMGAAADAYLEKRRLTQPVEPSAGSIFRNPPGDHAGRLIEAAGLKSQRCGGAQVSPRHANFIINAGGASAADVRQLIGTVQAGVYNAFGIDLIPEILYLGEF